MIKLVIFDLDGTLVNSLTDLALSVNFALKEVGLKPYDIDCYRQFVGNGRDVLIKKALADKSDDTVLFEKVKKLFDEHYEIHSLDNTHAYEGAGKLLNELKQKGILTAVHSNKPDEFVAKILNKAFPGYEFTFAFGQRKEFKRKPSGDAVKAMMKKLDLSPDECIYVGDSDVDVLTGHDAGIKVCGATWGFRGKDELIATGADYTIDAPTELLNILF